MTPRVKWGPNSILHGQIIQILRRIADNLTSWLILRHNAIILMPHIFDVLDKRNE